MKKNSGQNLTVIVPDIHFPSHNEEAVAITKRAIAKLKPSRTIFLGDILDCTPFSFHGPKLVEEVRRFNFLEEEVFPARDFLNHADKHSRDEVVFIEGNHEYRVERWAINNGSGAQAIYEAISPKYLLSEGRSNSRFRYIPYVKQTDPGFSYYEVTPNLIAIHGWSWARASARIHLDKARSRSVVFGHTHRQQTEASRDPFTKERVVSFSVGCLCELQPIYATGGSPSDWVLGFGLIYVSKKDPRDWTEYTLTIQNGRVILPDGTEISGD